MSQARQTRRSRIGVLLVLAVLSVIGPGCAGRLGDLVRLGRVDLESKRFASARAKARRVLARDSRSTAATEVLVEAWLGERGGAETLRRMKEWVARAPADPVASYAVAYTWFLRERRREPRRTDAALDRLLRAHPLHGAGLRLRAVVRLRQGRRAEAVRLLERVVRRTPRDFDAMRYLVRIRAAQGQGRQLAAFHRRLPTPGRGAMRAVVIAMARRWLRQAVMLYAKRRYRRSERTASRGAIAAEAVGLFCLAGIHWRRAGQAAYGRRDLRSAVRLTERAARLCTRQKRFAIAAGYWQSAGAYRKMRGDFVGGLRCYRRAQRAWRRAGRPSKAIRALVYQGVELANLDRWAEAERAFAGALAAARSLGDGDLEAHALVSAGNACGNRGKVACAERRLRQALRLREKQKNQAQTASVLADLGKTLTNQGRAAEAVALLERALRLEKGEFTSAATLVNLGAAYRSAGDHVRALAMYRRAEVALRRPGFERFRAVALANIGNVYRSLGLIKTALRYHQRAMRLKRRFANQRELGTGLMELALDLEKMGRDADAVARTQEALALYQKSGAGQRVAEAQGMLAHLYERSGRIADAAALRAQAIATQRRLGHRAALSSSLLRLAIFRLSNKGSLVEVERLLGESRAVNGALGLPEDWRYPYLEGLIHERRRRPGQALASLSRAADLVDRDRRNLRAERFKVSFLADLTFIYHHLAEAALRVRPPRPELAFAALERRKARGLLDLLESTNVRADLGGASRVLVRRERRLELALGWVQRAVTRLASGAPAPARRRERLQKRRRQLLDELDAVRAELKAAQPLLPVPSHARPVSMGRVRNELLSPGQTLLVYSVGRSSSLLFAIAREGVRWYRLGFGEAAIARRVRRYRRRYLELRVVRRPKGLIRDGLALYRDLLGMVDPRLLQGRELIVVPDGPLATLPFEALVVAGDPALRQKTYLVERHAVTYAPSAAVLLALRARSRRHPRAKEGLVAVADPVYDFAAFRAGRSEGAVRPRGGRLRAATTEGAWLSRLPATGSEVRRIGALYPGKRRILVRADAREARIKAGALRGFRLVHLAGHGILDDNFQAVVLSLDPREREDGFLELREIYNLDLDAELVVLSACETGSGRMVSGEGVVGLTHGFLFAGAPRVVVSLWKVADESTADLMVELYRRLGTSGAPDVAGALRAAKLALLRGGRYEAPFHWAPFIAVGLPR